MTILPLNGGHAVFMDAAGRKNDGLVNCGDRDAVEFTLTPFLRAQGVNKIPRLMLTEGDGRNIGGEQLLNELSTSANSRRAACNFARRPTAILSRILKSRRRAIRF